MLLSRRLKHFNSLYHGAESVWDIGCDHGLLGLSFTNLASVKEIHLVDPSGPVISELTLKVKDSYITKTNVYIHHKRGQDLKLKTENSKCIYIAGMGGKEIQQILVHIENSLDGNDQVIISPHRKVLELREWLHQSQYQLRHEGVIFENQQFYPYLCLVKDKNLQGVSLFGDKIWSGEVGKAYCHHQIQAFSGHRDRISMDYLAYLRNIDK